MKSFYLESNISPLEFYIYNVIKFYNLDLTAFFFFPIHIPPV